MNLQTIVRTIVPPTLATLYLLSESFSPLQNQFNPTANANKLAAEAQSVLKQNTLPFSDTLSPNKKTTSQPSSQPTDPQIQQKGAKTITISVSAPGTIKGERGNVLARLNSYSLNSYGYKLTLSPKQNSVRIETQGIIYVQDKWLNAQVVQLNFDNNHVSTHIIKGSFPVRAGIAPPLRPQMSPYIRAFLDVIALAEVGTLDESGYQSLVHSGKFDNYAQHPNVLQCGMIREKENCSTAAGRYQFLNTTWNELKEGLGLKDFSPYNQDLAAIELIRQKGALPYIESGDFQTALMLVNTVWAGLPGSPYNQNPIDESTAIQFAYDRLNVYLSSL